MNTFAENAIISIKDVAKAARVSADPKTPVVPLIQEGQIAVGASVLVRQLSSLVRSIVSYSPDDCTRLLKYRWRCGGIPGPQFWRWILATGWTFFWLAHRMHAGEPVTQKTGWNPRLEHFALPSKSTFPPQMPRYPNLWFYVDKSLAANYAAAVQLVTKGVQNAMQLREIPGPFDNPEGCDSDFRLEHLQPWETREYRRLQHSHAFHLRYYHSALEAKQSHTTRLKTPRGENAFFRLAASVHYEVEHTNPNHADVEICPICGRTGPFAELKGNLVEMVHDPLGLELLLGGTVRSETVRFEDWKQEPVGSVARLSSQFSIQHFEYPGLTGDQNTLKIGIVVLTPSK